MAKIEYSALVNRIRGRVSHSVISFWKGIGIVKRHNSGVHQPRTEAQQQVRGFFSDLAGEFYALSDTLTDLWRAHASMLSKPMTALNAYIGYNMSIQKYLPGTARLTGPPKTPDTPKHIEGFTVYPMSAADFCVQWTAHTLTTIYTIVDLWAMPGRDSVTNPRWTFGSTAGACVGEVLVATEYPTNTVVKFRVRTMDAFGRTSPWSHTLIAAAL